MRNVAMIMASGQSKRVPMKNIADICGRPALSYVIEIARVSGVCDRIVVATDSEAIAEVGEREGAETLLRPVEWAELRLTEATEKCYEKYCRENDVSFKYCTQMFGAVVFWRPSWLREAIRRMEEVREKGLPIGALSSGPQGCICQRMSLFSSQYTLHWLHHRGINIDIDYPEDLELARQVMAKIKSGEIYYPLEESIH